jgi:hypothetical protein
MALERCPEKTETIRTTIEKINMNQEQEPRRNWASKLEQLPTPDPAGSWPDMRSRLDREMPLSNKKGTRRWAILTLLLLVVLGVCNCPGLVQVNTVNRVATNWNSNKTSGARIRTSPSVKKINDSNRAAGQSKSAAASRLLPDANHQPIFGLVIKNSKAKEKKPVKPGPEPVMAAAGKENKPIRPNQQNRHILDSVNSQARKPAPDQSAQTNPVALSKDNAISQNKLQQLQAGGFSPTGKDSLKKPGLRAKTASNPLGDDKTKASGKPGIQEDYGKGWEVGLGLNQFFPIGQQHSSNSNSSGLTGGLSDYIPVPVIRYYFDRKSYIQVEAEINCPQYTGNLLASQAGSIGNGVSLDQQSTYIQKLFYFNLPLSIQYSPVRHLYAGTGLQFSALTNGVALFQDKEITAGYPDSVKFSKRQSLKSTAVYKELTTTEWRFLFDLNYHWKPITIGIRYNQALSKFINIRISNTEITQARNSSLQIYLRYILWKNRKKIIIPAKGE